MLTGVDQVGIHRGLNLGVADKLPAQQLIEICLGNVVQQLGVKLDRPIIQGGDFKLTQLHPIVAGHLV